VPDDRARYIWGSDGARLSAAPELRVYHVEIRTDSDAGFELDAGKYGALVIPYATISFLHYGPYGPPFAPQFPPETTYPWSTEAHRYGQFFLRIGFRKDEVSAEEFVLLGLGRNLVRRTLATLEQRTGHTVVAQVLEACTQFKEAAECGVADPMELRGVSKVFVDTTGSGEWTEGESYDRIASTITATGSGLQVVSSREDADVILAFRYFGGTRPQWLQTSNSESDRAVGEVYLVRPDSLPVVMVFDEDLNLWRRNLAIRFAERFIAAVENANRQRARGAWDREPD